MVARFEISKGIAIPIAGDLEQRIDHKLLGQVLFKIAKDELQTYAFPDTEETREKISSLRTGDVQTITIIEAAT
jgi:hypothetical protein